ncbi:MAG TPA: AraC family transcriptional regulator [Armatimonadota bacterium]|nr:AraC family transcriptional regulator [Armatimonadota bacterium]
MIPLLAKYNLQINRSGCLLGEPGWRWPLSNTCRDYDLIYIWGGEGHAVYDGVPFDLRPGSLVLLRPHVAYEATHNPENRLGHCYIHFDIVDENGRQCYLPENALPPRHCRVHDVDLVDQVLRHVVKLSLDGGELANLHATQYLMAVLLEAFATGNEERHDEPSVMHEHRLRLAPVVRYIRENPGKQHRVSDLAHMANYSVYHFGRIFKRLYGMSPKDFCIRARVFRARELLLETDLSVEQIAVNLGYADMFFFSRQFKAWTGQSPNYWRVENRHRADND